ncbi:MAG: plastocyanin/azurin family copper-binding protein [Gemmatimonadales bacterium]
MPGSTIPLAIAISFTLVVSEWTPSAAVQQAHARNITILTTRDSAGMRFSPSRIVAHRGDILHFVNGAGRHNVDFVADSNPRNVALPPVTPLLETAGATVDIPVDLPPGRYYIQCDPHAAMGMVGHLIVER